MRQCNTPAGEVGRTAPVVHMLHHDGMEARNGSAMLLARRCVADVGASLASLCLRFYTGDLDKEDSRAWRAGSSEIVRGTHVFILGGSIGLEGYTAAMLPRLARAFLRARADSPAAATLAGRIEFLPTSLSGAEAGALGAFQMLPASARRAVEGRARGGAGQARKAAVVLVDVGGTRTRAFAYTLSSRTGRPGGLIARHETATLTHTAPAYLYAQIAASIGALVGVLARRGFDAVGPFAVGQPGRFESPKGPIQPNSAIDLGPLYPGSNPSELLRHALTARGLEHADVFVFNDGRCQGLGHLDALRDTPAWTRLAGKTVVYLGLGTGLGASYLRVTGDGDIEVLDLHNAFDFAYPDAASIVRWPETVGNYGDALSGKYLRNFMREANREAAAAGREPPFPAAHGGPEPPLVNALLEESLDADAAALDDA